MTEKEKQAIEYLNSIRIGTTDYISFGRTEKAVDIILNLINKQQKEIEKLNDIIVVLIESNRRFKR